MIKQFKPYPKYKDSGMPWLGKVPAHWEVRRLKFILREIDNRSESGIEQLLSVSQYTGVTKRFSSKDSTKSTTRAESLVGYKCVEPNDLVINIMLAWNGSLGVSNYSGIVSPAYCVYRFGNLAEPWYYHYLLRSPLYRDRIKAFSTGVVESRLRLYTENLYRLEAILPPLPEQQAIVRFLDWAEGRIRKAIRLRQRRIKLLQEYKQALIHQAVTGKIDVRTGQPYPEYKDSGVEWLGKVPAHWEVRRLTQIAQILVSNVDKHIHENEYPIRLCNYVDVYKNDYITGNIDFMRATATKDERERFQIRIGDVIITKDSEDWTDIGVPAYVDYEANDLICGYHLAILRPIKSFIRGKFLFRAIQSQGVSTQFRVSANGVTRYGLSHNSIKSVLIPVPSIYEQEAIASFLDAQSKNISKAIAADRRAIELLKEFRTTLIAEVVTGKLDVREAAAQLPETPESEEEDLAEIEEEPPEPQEEEPLFQEEADD